MKKKYLIILTAIAILAIAIVSCKKTQPQEAVKSVATAEVKYSFAPISPDDKLLSVKGDIFNYDLGGVNVLSTNDVEGGLSMKDELVPPQEGGICNGSNNVFLIKRGDENILVDAGYGNLNPNSSMTKNYDNYGIKSEDIKTIIITHLHPDHAGGLINGAPTLFDGKPTAKYPNAKIFIPKKELEFWTQDMLAPDVASELYYTKLDWAGGNTFFVFGSSVVKDVLKLYGDKIVTFDEKFSGNIAEKDFISKLNAFGHTAGHTAYIVKGANKSLMIAGDFVNCASAQFDNTSVSAIYDYNRAEAKKSREMIMKYASDNKLVVGGSHIKKPGFITINQK